MGDRFGNRPDGLKVPLGGDRKPGLDDVDSQFLQLLGDSHLFSHIHRRPGGLFSVPEGCVEYLDLRFQPLHSSSSQNSVTILLKSSSSSQIFISIRSDRMGRWSIPNFCNFNISFSVVTIQSTPLLFSFM